MSITNVPNGRDLGGLSTSHGRATRSGRLYRSAAVLGPLATDAVRDLGISHVYDLRTEPERTARPDELPVDAQLVVADVLADDPGSGPASLGRIARLAADGDREHLSTQQLKETFEAGYRSFVSLGSAQTASRSLLTNLASGRDVPVLVHCTAGKDRTGWLVALALLAVGVSEDDVMADYLASEAPVWDMFAPYREQFAAKGGDVETMRVAIGVFPEYLAAALDEMHSRYGNIDDYLASGLGLGDSVRETLAGQLLS